MSDLRNEIESAINRHSAENGSDTPDFILADFLIGCLQSFDRATRNRDAWYGRKDGLAPWSNQAVAVAESQGDDNG